MKAFHDKFICADIYNVCRQRSGTKLLIPRLISDIWNLFSSSLIVYK